MPKLRSFLHLVLLLAAILGMTTIAGCDSSPTAPDSVLVQAEIRVVGFVIVYRDQSEPRDKYVRVDLEVSLEGVPVWSGSVANHDVVPIDVFDSGVGEYSIFAQARASGGELVGSNVFNELVVTGGP